jgi:hypothetical protein
VIVDDNMICRLVTVELPEQETEGGLRGGLDSAEQETTRQVEADGQRILHGPTLFNWEWYPGKLRYLISFTVIDDEGGVE